jgi:RHS repeat-associated protein
MLNLEIPMGCQKLTYHPEKTSLKVVYNALKNNEKSCVGVYRYGFNGMEKDEVVKGNGNSYDFGAKMYDSRVGRWLSADPLERKYPMVTPYMFANNSPIIYNDPDGKSGELTIVKDANGKPTKFVIKANLHFYTGDISLSKFNHKRLVNEMVEQFNSQKLELSYDGQTLPVELDLNSDLTYSNDFNHIKFEEDGSFEPANHTKAHQILPGNNTDFFNLKNNYIRIEDLNTVSKNSIGGQTGLWNVNDLEKGSTTALHEFLHGLGMIHPRVYLEDGSGGYYESTEVDLEPGSDIPISYPKNTKYKSTGKNINPNDRVVTDNEINQFIINVMEIRGNTYIGVGNPSTGSVLTDREGNTIDSN